MPALHVELPAEPASAARSRRATREWLASLCGVNTLCDTGEDIVLAVNEAVSNGIEHAYPGGAGTVTLDGRVRETGRRAPDEAGYGAELEICIEVADHGSWRAPSGDPGYRGRGLQMAEAVVDELDVDHGPDGTVVRLHRSLGCPAAAMASRSGGSSATAAPGCVRLRRGMG